MDLIASYIKNSPHLTALRAIEVYQEDYQARLTEALKNTYRASYFLLGDREFKHLAKDYISSYPSQSSDLDDYGFDMELFLKSHQLGKEYPFLSSMIHFEWTFRNIFHKKWDIGLAGSEIEKAIMDDKPIYLVNSLCFLQYDFLISKLYFLKDNNSDYQNPIEYENKEFIIMYKKNEIVLIKTFSQNQWQFLKIITAPTSFSKLIQEGETLVTKNELQDIFHFLNINSLLKY